MQHSGMRHGRILLIGGLSCLPAAANAQPAREVVKDTAYFARRIADAGQAGNAKLLLDIERQLSQLTRRQFLLLASRTG
jgi:hypothetical protein